MEFALPSWSFDIVDVSADEPRHLEIHVYPRRQGHMALLANCHIRPLFLSFMLPFSDQEAWSEEIVLSFTCAQIQQHLAS